MPISVNQAISFTDPSQVSVSGVVTGDKVIDNVSVSSNQNLVTSNALHEDASWGTVVSFDGTTDQLISATANYGDGTSDSTGLILASNAPLDNQYTSLFFTGDGYAGSVFTKHGRDLYDFTTVSDGNNQQFFDAVGSGGASIAYTDFNRSIETIENFRPTGPNHDKLNLSDTSLQTLAQVLHHTTMSDGDATIHIAPDEAVTLVGVSKAQLASHPHDFVFTGGHTLS